MSSQPTPPSPCTGEKPPSAEGDIAISQGQNSLHAGSDARSIAIFVGVVVLLLVADLLLKSWAFANVAGEPIVLGGDPNVQRTTIPSHEPRVLIPHVLQLWLTTNTGAVFGMGKGRQALFAVISVLAVGVIGYLFWRSEAKEKIYHLSLAMILAGALGNLYDRLRFNAVRDMLHLFPGVKLPMGLSWPGGNSEVYPWIFNFADVSLVVGVILLMLIMWQADKQPRVVQKVAS